MAVSWSPPLRFRWSGARSGWRWRGRRPSACRSSLQPHYSRQALLPLEEGVTHPPTGHPRSAVRYALVHSAHELARCWLSCFLIRGDYYKEDELGPSVDVAGNGLLGQRRGADSQEAWSSLAARIAAGQRRACEGTGREEIVVWRWGNGGCGRAGFAMRIVRRTAIINPVAIAITAR